MSQPTLSNQLETTLQDETIGRLAVGDSTLSVGSVHGALLSDHASESVIELRQTPIVQIPRAFAGLVGRQTEIELAIAALRTKQIVEIYGQAGIGKSVLLRYLAHSPQITTSHPDGIADLSGVGSVGDRLQTLFDTFYHSCPDIKLSDREVRQALRERQVLILLDDDALTATDLQQLIAALPNSTFLIASRDRRLWGDGRSIGLEGLSLSDSVTLIDRELGRFPSRSAESLAPPQKKTIEALWKLLQGNPQRLLQVAALAREDRLSLETVLSQIQPDELEQSLTRLILASLPKPQRWIMAVLVAMGNTGLLPEQIAVITGPPNPLPSLQALVQRHLLQIEGHHYRLSSSLVEILQKVSNSTPWMEKVLTYLLPWAETHPRSPNALLAEQPLILHTLEWAVSQARWAETLRLVRSLEGALALGKQWETWGRVLNWGLQAAWALEDATSEAWGLHQLGTLALCQEEVTTAYDALTEAINLRSLLNDEVGERLSRHNLEHLRKITLPISEGERSQLVANPLGVYLTLGLIGFLVFVLSGLVGLAIVNRFGQPVPTVKPTPAHTRK
ncbi:hypothetical protein C7B65_09345 [Phormidesmis priestleyi ULC007]|uniref:NB-ARC domain-containing protein n=1 Tax=Phormidesmis priestleyi ULC007 TaxID=1920490 RepID=A0A2T1DHG1_9CYAN|nr:NB-ARC domain-containing protein [Phormidesmis priestleyi]PSB19871.1 hypothetical protein C7B65_09345 [Phormidesmis priestleyi ULC007]PZO49198.1 MAG: hypothetical protein DCF14_14745 [Phormidesmis priestleyi]